MMFFLVASRETRTPTNVGATTFSRLKVKLMDENVVKKGLTFFVFGHDDGVDSGGTVSFTTRKCLVLSGNLCLDDFYVCFFIGN